MVGATSVSRTSSSRSVRQMKGETGFHPIRRNSSQQAPRGPRTPFHDRGGLSGAQALRRKSKDRDSPWLSGSLAAFHASLAKRAEAAVSKEAVGTL